MTFRAGLQPFKQIFLLGSRILGFQLTSSHLLREWDPKCKQNALMGLCFSQTWQNMYSTHSTKEILDLVWTRELYSFAQSSEHNAYLRLTQCWNQSQENFSGSRNTLDTASADKKRVILPIQTDGQLCFFLHFWPQINMPLSGSQELTVLWTQESWVRLYKR